MRSRHSLHDILVEIVGNDNVYYQPPESKKLKYPAIVYKLDRIKKITADNKWYCIRPTYQATLIYRESDSPLPMKMAMLDRCTHVSHFASDNLYHDVYSIEI